MVYTLMLDALHLGTIDGLYKKLLEHVAYCEGCSDHNVVIHSPCTDLCKHLSVRILLLLS